MTDPARRIENWDAGFDTTQIKATLDIDFVPNLYRVMASKPEYLEANWNRVKSVMVQPGKLDRLTKEIIAVAVSAVNGCEY